MKRYERLVELENVMMHAGARGLTLGEIVERLNERGYPVQRRQLYRDLEVLRRRGIMVTDDDPSEEQLARGARRVYFVDRGMPTTLRAIRLGRSLEVLENHGARVFGDAVRLGHITLNHAANTPLGRLAPRLRDECPRSLCLVFASIRYAQFWLEVPEWWEGPLDIRIGRLERADQSPQSALAANEVLIGLPGPESLSRLFGPRGGHLAIEVPSCRSFVRVRDLSTAGWGLRAVVGHHHLGEGTPIANTEPGLATVEVHTSSELVFGGVRGFVSLPSKLE